MDKALKLLLLFALAITCKAQVMQIGVVNSATAAGPCGTPGAISDSFVGVAGTALHTYNVCWVNLSGTYVVSGFKLGTTSGTVVPTGIFVLAGALYSGDTSDTSQIILNPPTTPTLAVQGPLVRATQNSTLGYWGVLDNISGGNYTNACIYKAGSSQGCTTVSLPTASPHTLKIVASGTGTVTVTFLVDGTLRRTFNDSSSPFNSGTPGFVVQADNVNVLDSIFAGPWQDN